MRIRSSALFLSVFLLPACDDGGIERDITIDHYSVPCVSEGTSLCLRIAEHGGDFERHYGPIEGYSWEWGTAAELRILETEVEPVMDGSSLRWQLVEVVSETPMSPGDAFEAPFDLSLAGLGYTPFLERQGSGGTLLDGKEFACADDQVCTDLDAAIAAAGDATLGFRYGDPVSGPLILDDVQF